jgi:hypothetical protein
LLSETMVRSIDCTVPFCVSVFPHITVLQLDFRLHTYVMYSEEFYCLIFMLVPLESVLWIGAKACVVNYRSGWLDPCFYNL